MAQVACDERTGHPSAKENFHSYPREGKLRDLRRAICIRPYWAASGQDPSGDDECIMHHRPFIASLSLAVLVMTRVVWLVHTMLSRNAGQSRGSGATVGQIGSTATGSPGLWRLRLAEATTCEGEGQKREGLRKIPPLSRFGWIHSAGHNVNNHDVNNS